MDRLGADGNATHFAAREYAEFATWIRRWISAKFPSRQSRSLASSLARAFARALARRIPPRFIRALPRSSSPRFSTIELRIVLLPSPHAETPTTAHRLQSHRLRFRRPLLVTPSFLVATSYSVRIIARPRRSRCEGTVRSQSLDRRKCYPHAFRHVEFAQRRSLSIRFPLLFARYFVLPAHRIPSSPTSRSIDDRSRCQNANPSARRSGCRLLVASSQLRRREAGIPRWWSDAALDSPARVLSLVD